MIINIEPLLLKLKNRRLVVLGVPAVVGLLLGSMLVVKPAFNRLVSIKSEIQGLKQKEQSYNIILDSEKRVGELKGRFSGDKSWLIEQLNTIAEKTGFSIINILPEDTKNVGDYLEQTSVRIDAEGDFHQLGEFVSRVESLEPYIKMLSISINTETLPSLQQGPLGSAPIRGRRNFNVYTINLSVGLISAAGTAAA